MTKSLPLALFAAASLCCGSAAFAQAAPKTTAKTVATSKTTTTIKPAMGKPTTTSRTTTKTAVATPKGRLVTTKTSTGKTITYDCGKAGNANKAACKK